MLKTMTGETLNITRLDSWVIELTVTKLVSVNKTLEIKILITLEDLKAEIALAKKPGPAKPQKKG